MRRDRLALLTGAANLATTANAFRPVQRRGPLSLVAFASGLPTSELPVQTALMQAGIAAALARRGGLRTPVGMIGAGLTAASCLGLAQLYRASTRAAGPLEAALADGLGERYRDRIDSGFVPAAEVALTRLRILLPDFTARRRYRVARNVSYGPHGRKNALDVWRRADLDPSRPAPVLVQVHGGGWTSGMKEGQGEPLMGHLAEHGWVCVAPNYRVGAAAGWPDQIVDVKRVLAWVKERIGEYGGDPGFVVITGGSAGAHLASLAALTPHRRDWQPGFEDADTSVAAAVSLYGIYDFLNRNRTGRTDWEHFLETKLFKTSVAAGRDVWDQASPVSQVTADAPPFFVLHGINDSLSPVEEARDFVRELRATSHAPVAYAELPLAQHAFDTLPSVRAHHVVHAVERFLAVVRSERPAAG